MPRYIIQRTFQDGLTIPTNQDGAIACSLVVERNADHGVTWIHSYVSEDHKKLFCVYDGPSVEAVRESAQANNLPLDSITPVTVLDPYFYRVQ